MSYWYNSLNNNYPLTREEKTVFSVQSMRSCYIVEMTREVTPKEIAQSKLIYLSHGSWGDKHVQEKIQKLKYGEVNGQ